MTGNTFYTYYEAKQVCIDNNITSHKEYKQFRKIDNRLPGSPHKKYKKEWEEQGTIFVKVSFYDYDTSRQLCIDNNITSFLKYQQFQKTDNRLPSDPNRTYQNNWINWDVFLGKRNNDFYTYTEATQTCQKKQITKSTEYHQARQEDTRFPSNPSSFYEKDWVNWDVFLGKQEKDYYTYEQAQKVCNKQNITSAREYQKYRLKDNLLPSKPYQKYVDQWVSWDIFLNKNKITNHKILRQLNKETILTIFREIYENIDNLNAAELLAILSIQNEDGSKSDLTKAWEAIRRKNREIPILTTLATEGDFVKNIEKVLTTLGDDKDRENIRNRRKEEQTIEEESIQIYDVPSNKEEETNATLPTLKPTNWDAKYKIDGLPISSAKCVDFFIKTRSNKMLAELHHEVITIDQVYEKQVELEGTLTQQVFNRTVDLYQRAETLVKDNTHKFDFRGRKGEKLKPSLMQSVTALTLCDQKRLLNAADVGTGKTFSAILSSLAIKAHITVIITVNNTLPGWAKSLECVVPDANIMVNPQHFDIQEDNRNYILFNYEKFQQEASSIELIQQITNLGADFLILDECHSVKSLKSLRAERIQTMARHFEYCLGLTATPITNNIKEFVFTQDVILGTERYKDIKLKNDVMTAFNLHRDIQTDAVLWFATPDYNDGFVPLNEIEHTIDGEHLRDELKDLETKDVAAIENCLLDAKLDTIQDLVKKGSIIFSLFTNNMIDKIRSVVEAKGLTVAVQTGGQKEVDLFLDGKVDVLIASKVIEAGVDRLQYVSDNIIIASPVWTFTSQKQLIGRIQRQNSAFDNVYIHKLIVELEQEQSDAPWSWDRQRFEKIKYKRTLFDSLVYGVVPDVITEEEIDIMKVKGKHILQGLI